MNIICMPYHDWRKIQSEGFRTRDAHFIEHLVKSQTTSKVLVINRPMSLVEFLVKKKGKKIVGKKLLHGNGYTLYEINEKLFLLDILFNQILEPIKTKKAWFFKYYGHQRVTNAVARSISYLNFNPDVLLSQNIFAIELFKNIKTPVKIFDAWDNFLQFPDNSEIKIPMRKAYEDYAKEASYWVTNSEKNVEYFSENYGQDKCLLIRNGVDTERFTASYPLPQDMSSIRRPIVGFGGKISHLFDYDVFNYATNLHKDKSFVLIGQILDPAVFKNIVQRDNVHYLGDKHYQNYPSYITNFDIGIIPYVTNDLETGADSIKAYEYLAANLEVVGTSGGGTASMSERIKIGKTKEEFSEQIKFSGTKKGERKDLSSNHLWAYKVKQLTDLIAGLQTK